MSTALVPSLKQYRFRLCVLFCKSGAWLVLDSRAANRISQQRTATVTLMTAIIMAPNQALCRMQTAGHQSPSADAPGSLQGIYRCCWLHTNGLHPSISSCGLLPTSQRGPSENPCYDWLVPFNTGCQMYSYCIALQAFARCMTLCDSGSEALLPDTFMCQDLGL